MSVAPDDVSALFPGPDAWDGSPYGPPINSSNSHGFRPLFSRRFTANNPIPATSEPDTVHTPMDVMQVSFNDLTRLTSTGGPPAVMHFRPHTGILPQCSWVSLNASRSPSTDLNNTISPLQTCFDSQSFSNASVSADGHMRSSTASSFDRSNDADEDAHTQKRRRRSDTTHNSGTHFSKTKPAMGRRRASEDVEPGSARAIYLEKNRKAANKCRNKQKAQQEALVESAREYERRNRLLKAEVDLLKADMRDLMELVGKHADCPDKRLQTYVRREADRLAAKDKNDVVAQLLSAEDGISPIQA